LPFQVLFQIANRYVPITNVVPVELVPVVADAGLAIFPARIWQQRLIQRTKRFNRKLDEVLIAKAQVVARVDYAEEVTTQIGEPPPQNYPAASKHVVRKPALTAFRPPIFLLEDRPAYSSRLSREMHHHEVRAKFALEAKRRAE